MNKLTTKNNKDISELKNWFDDFKLEFDNHKIILEGEHVGCLKEDGKVFLESAKVDKILAEKGATFRTKSMYYCHDLNERIMPFSYYKSMVMYGVSMCIKGTGIKFSRPISYWGKYNKYVCDMVEVKAMEDGTFKTKLQPNHRIMNTLTQIRIWFGYYITINEQDIYLNNINFAHISKNGKVKLLDGIDEVLEKSGYFFTKSNLVNEKGEIYNYIEWERKILVEIIMYLEKNEKEYMHKLDEIEIKSTHIESGRVYFTCFDEPGILASIFKIPKSLNDNILMNF